MKIGSPSHWFEHTAKTVLIVFVTLAGSLCRGEQPEILFREEFDTLKSWKPLYFPKIKKHSTYTIESQGSERYLKAESNASASGIIYKSTFDVHAYPRIKWRWKVENVYENGNAKAKAGDDYTLRVYVIFKYDPKRAGFLERAKYNSARLIYGEYPPHSGINYIWANKEHKERIIANSYTEKSQMILLQKGRSNVGKWLTEDVNILRDHRMAFGTRAPRIASIAIMNDSDNTGEKSISYIDYIHLYR